MHYRAPHYACSKAKHDLVHTHIPWKTPAADLDPCGTRSVTGWEGSLTAQQLEGHLFPRQLHLLQEADFSLG